MCAVDCSKSHTSPSRRLRSALAADRWLSDSRLSELCDRLVMREDDDGEPSS